jgi:cytoskeletal protein CcmA (bactofilin family)
MQAGFGKSIVVKGDVTATEDIVVSGRIEGTVILKDHVLTVLDGGDVAASIVAKSVIVLGAISGDVEALERVELRDGCTLSGDLLAPRIVMAEGAILNGTVEMSKRT